MSVLAIGPLMVSSGGRSESLVDARDFLLTENQTVLDSESIRRLVAGTTVKGRAYDGGHYELFFALDGSARFLIDPDRTAVETWDIDRDGVITSRWPAHIADGYPLPHHYGHDLDQNYYTGLSFSDKVRWTVFVVEKGNTLSRAIPTA